MSNRLSDVWKAWINDALPKLARNDRAKWELAASVTPEGLVFGLHVTMPAPVMGHHLQRVMVVSNPQAARKEQVLELLGGMVESMHKEKVDMLAQGLPQNGEGPRAAGQSPGGLILPG